MGAVIYPLMSFKNFRRVKNPATNATSVLSWSFRARSRSRHNHAK